MTLRSFLCLFLVLSCYALDLFSFKGRRANVATRLKVGKYVSKNVLKPDAVTTGDVIYRNETVEVERKDNSTAFLVVNQTLNHNLISEVNLNGILSQKESPVVKYPAANASAIQTAAPYETEVILNEVLNQRATSVETEAISNENFGQNETRIELNQSLNQKETGIELNKTVGQKETGIELNKTVGQKETGIELNESVGQSKTRIKQNETLHQNTSSQEATKAPLETSNQNKTNEEPEKLSRKPRGRSSRYLSPGQEFLLSVADLEDVRGSNLKKLPYLMNFLQMNRQITRRKGGNTEHLDWPQEMLDLMRAAGGFDKSDEKPTSFLSNFSSDPMNLILPVVIPVSILLAAVLPLLSHQFTTGLYMPMVSTTATGDKRGRNLEDKNSTDLFVPLLESLVSLGAETFDDVTEESYDETKARFLKQAYEMVTSFVNEKWKGLSNKFLRSNGSCKDKNNCTVSRTGSDDSLY
ncbi:uncharacterized protein TNCT_231961 [Trichonephila clavata]|uniref:Uncharacterized protein n=1 Tax=Trichonephila clavata TaxID=2740835 RepID=A0A8X6LQB5_TRICU|nr:uncharacterized protein TNCT_231961 [Trichonephila clavata]